MKFTPNKKVSEHNFMRATRQKHIHMNNNGDTLYMEINLWLYSKVLAAVVVVVVALRFQV